MEIICDYFKENYVVLWNRGVNAISNPIAVKNYIERLLDDDCNILVAVDDIHNNQNSSIFFIREEIKRHKKRDNVKFILTARSQDFKRLTNPQNLALHEILSQDVRDAIRDFFYKVREKKY